MRLRTAARILLTIISAPFVVVAYLNIETYAQSKGWDAVLKTALEGNMPTVLEVALQPWVGVTGVGVLAFTFGLWVDALLKGFDSRRPTRAERIAALGKRSIKLSSDIGVTLSNYEENELPPSIFAEIRAIYVEYQKYGLPKLGTTLKLNGTQKLQLARTFLSHIGPLLRDGHYKEAKRVADKLIENVRALERPEPQSLQDTEAETR